MYLLIDVGATKTRLAWSKNGVSFEEPLIISSYQDFEEAVVELGKIYEKCFQKRGVEKVAMGLPGIFDKDFNTLVAAHNLPLWVGKPLKKRLADVFINASIYLENDAALAGLGEAVKGAGKDYGIVAYITISTGVGGVRIVDKKIDRKSSGFEPGHQIVDIDQSWFNQRKVCGKDYLDLGDMISGIALEERFGVKAHKIDDEKVWHEVTQVLATGLANTILHWSPEVVILGGGLMNKIAVDKVKEAISQVLKTYPQKPEIKKAELGDYSGLHGALEYLKQKS